jgi:capsid protein
MATQDITLHLSEEVMHRARKAAEALQRPVEEILAETLAAGLPDVTDAPMDLQAELARMTWLSDDILWQIAHSTMDEAEQNTLHALLALQQERPLQPSEQHKLELLRQAYGRTTLRKARAYALLTLRSGKALLNFES